MKNFIIILSVFLMTNLAVNGQEIIKTKPIEQIEVKSPTFRYPEAKNGMPGKDTTINIRICSPSRAGHLAQNKPLFVVNYGKRQLKGKTPLLNFNPNWISKIDVLKDEKSTEIYGLAGKNGVIIIQIKNEFVKDFKKLLKESSDT